MTGFTSNDFLQEQDRLFFFVFLIPLPNFFFYFHLHISAFFPPSLCNPVLCCYPRCCPPPLLGTKKKKSVGEPRRGKGEGGGGGGRRRPEVCWVRRELGRRPPSRHRFPPSHLFRLSGPAAFWKFESLSSSLSSVKTEALSWLNAHTVTHASGFCGKASRKETLTVTALGLDKNTGRQFVGEAGGHTMTRL